jgi:ABC-type molybdate transport system ATPase subunit
VKLALDHAGLSLPDFTLAIDATVDTSSLGITGPSGAGKTTLLEAIAGIRTLDSGSIAIDGREITHRPSRERRIGYVPQDETLFPHMPVRANIEYGAPRNTKMRGHTIEEVAAVLDIAPLLGRGVAKLSGGERRRVALARALMSDPSVLLDEPLTGLDAALRRRTIELLLEVRSRFATPLVFVSHERDEVIGLCDHAIVLDRGRVVAQGAPADVL